MNWLLFLILLAVAIKKSFQLQQCDGDCSREARSELHGCYRRENHTLCCNKCSLEELPTFTDKHLWLRLDLSENYIQHLPNGSFLGFERLAQLDLSNNRLTEVDDDAFRGLDRLTFLNISNHQDCMKWEMNNTDNLQSLTELDISEPPRNWQYAGFDECYSILLHNTVTSLSNLTKLHISYFTPFILPTFENLGRLSELFISSSLLTNHLDILDTSFNFIYKIRNLHLNYDSSVSGMHINIWANASLPFQTIHVNTKLRSDSCRKSLCYYNRAHQKLSRRPGLLSNNKTFLGDFFTVEHGHVYEDWDHSQPILKNEFQLHVYGGLPEMHNVLETEYPQLLTYIVNTLRTLFKFRAEFSKYSDAAKASETVIYNVTNNVFASQDRISNNAFIVSDLVKLANPTFFDDCEIRKNTFAEDSSFTTGYLSVTNILEKSCVLYLDYHIECDTSDNLLCNSTEIVDFIFSPRNLSAQAILRFLDLSNTPLGSLIIGDQHISSLMFLNLSNCHVDIVNPEFLRFPNLEVLDFSNNPLLFCHVRDSDFCIDGKTGIHFRELKELHMNNLSLSEFGPDLFGAFPSLQQLSLRRNRFNQIPISVLSALPNLTYLDLAENNIESIDSEVFPFLVSSMKEFSIDVSNNPFKCRCHNLGMFQNMLNASASFINLNSTLCQLQNKTFMPVTENGLALLEEECNFWKVILARAGYIFGLIIAAAVPLVLLGLVYRWRWAIARKFLTWRDRKIIDAQENIGEVGAEEYKYDAFVSHHHQEDYDWVVNTLLPQLEDERHLKLCMGQRDFIPGWPIMENIVTAVQNSRHTVVVLTPAFLTSQWCETELQLALARGLHHPVVVILDESVLNDTNLPKTIRQVLKTATYLKYSNNPEAQACFWHNLHRAVLQ